MNDNVKEWIQVADYDIDTVRLLLKERGHAPIIIYHMHQAIEKLLKALLCSFDIDVPKSHNIDKLLSDAIKIKPELAIESITILSIHTYLPKLRYPYGDEILFDEALDLVDGFYASVASIKKYVIHKT